MSTERDKERLLREWLDEGPNRAADRLLETVEERIDRQRQRPAWRLSWRNLFINRTVGSFAAGMAVVAVALVGFNVVSGRGTENGGPGGPAEPPAAAVPSPTLSSALPSGEPASDQSLAWSFEGTLPAGWDDYDGAFNTSDGMQVEIMPDRSVMASDCHYGPAEGIGTTADEITAALATREGLLVTGPTAVSVDGLSGQQLDVGLDADWTDTCPWWEEGTPVVPTIGAFNEKNYWFFNAVAPGNQYRLIVLDVPGAGNVLISVYAETPEAWTHLSDAMSIIDGITFDTTA